MDIEEIKILIDEAFEEGKKQGRIDGLNEEPTEEMITAIADAAWGVLMHDCDQYGGSEWDTYNSIKLRKQIRKAMTAKAIQDCIEEK